MFLFSKYWARILLVAAVSLVLYTEFMTYWLLPLQWIKKPVCVPPKCYKLLLVADPQILASPLGGQSLFRLIARWDSDRYIRKTFLNALDYIEPDFLIFLGDIMDSGHISSDEEFFADLSRFKKIFEVPELGKDPQVILLPGDNDIGGIDDIMLPQIVHRFDRIFSQSEGPVLLESLEFYKVNLLTYTFQEAYDIKNENSVRIALSHVPVLPRAGPFVQAVSINLLALNYCSSHALIKWCLAGYQKNSASTNFFWP